MRIPARMAILLLSGFFIVVLMAGFLSNPHFPALVLGRENSVGTWMSGALLTFMAALCLFISMRHRWYPWLLVAAFFQLLGLDERFMFHEQLKEYIIFSYQGHTLSRLVYELPVIVGACVGGFMALLLWRHLPAKSRLLLPGVVVLGTASVVIDVMAGGVLWEECFKLMAELLMASVLLMKVEDI